MTVPNATQSERGFPRTCGTAFKKKMVKAARKSARPVKRSRAAEAMAVPRIAPPGNDVEKGYLMALLHQLKLLYDRWHNEGALSE